MTSQKHNRLRLCCQALLGCISPVSSTSPWSMHGGWAEDSTPSLKISVSAQLQPPFARIVPVTSDSRPVPQIDPLVVLSSKTSGPESEHVNVPVESADHCEASLVKSDAGATHKQTMPECVAETVSAPENEDEVGDHVDPQSVIPEDGEHQDDWFDAVVDYIVSSDNVDKDETEPKEHELIDAELHNIADEQDKSDGMQKGNGLFDDVIVNDEDNEKELAALEQNDDGILIDEGHFEDVTAEDEGVNNELAAVEQNDVGDQEGEEFFEDVIVEDEGIDNEVAAAEQNDDDVQKDEIFLDEVVDENENGDNELAAVEEIDGSAQKDDRFLDDVIVEDEGIDNELVAVEQNDELQKDDAFVDDVIIEDEEGDKELAGNELQVNALDGWLLDEKDQTETKIGEENSLGEGLVEGAENIAELEEGNQAETGHQEEPEQMGSSSETPEGKQLFNSEGGPNIDKPQITLNALSLDTMRHENIESNIRPQNIEETEGVIQNIDVTDVIGE